MVLNDKMDCKYCWDNCIYNNVEAGQVSNFEVYNIIAKLNIVYAYTKEYSDLFFYDEDKKLLVANLIKDLQTIANQSHAYEKALNNFAL